MLVKRLTYLALLLATSSSEGRAQDRPGVLLISAVSEGTALIYLDDSLRAEHGYSPLVREVRIVGGDTLSVDVLLRKMTTEELAREPVLTPMDVRPEIRNVRDVVRALEREYPKPLAEVYDFTPALLDGEPVPVWVQLPIPFATR
jgi:hypothetical protein